MPFFRCAVRTEGPMYELRKSSRIWKELGITAVELMPSYEFLELEKQSAGKEAWMRPGITIWICLKRRTSLPGLITLGL